MTTPENQMWSGAVQRELDGLQRTVDSRFVDFSLRLDKLLTLTEYHADQRAIDIRLENITERVHESDHDIDLVKTEVRTSFQALQKEILAERQRFEDALRKQQEAQQSRFRWLVSMVLIPVVGFAVELMLKR
jgi:hypothetical protein